MADLDLEELKRLLAEMSERISPEMAKHDVAIKLVLASVDIMSDLIARVKRAEKERDDAKDLLRLIRSASYSSGVDEWPEAMKAISEFLAEDDRRILSALTGDTPNV